MEKKKIIKKRGWNGKNKSEKEQSSIRSMGHGRRIRSSWSIPVPTNEERGGASTHIVWEVWQLAVIAIPAVVDTAVAIDAGISMVVQGGSTVTTFSRPGRK